MSTPPARAPGPHAARPPAAPATVPAALLTVKEVAARLGVSTKLVYALCAGGKIVHERHGLGRGTIRISEEAVEAYRRAARVEHGAAPAPLKHLSPPPRAAGRRRAPS
jgi:excisionase family DNA binding protein